MPEPAIVTHALTKSYGATPVLRGLDLRVEAGTLVALLGPNGAGKTTTVRILSTLLRPDGGSARVAGHDVVAEPDAVRRVLGLAGQQTSVDGLLTGRENLVMLSRLNHLRRRDARRRADELLERFDLVGAAHRPVRTYSGGMRRRLDLAASLVAAPSIVFLDEPTTGLDPRARQAMWDVVRDLLAAGTTLLLTTQYLEEADQLADRIAVIDDGHVVAEGTADELKRRVGSERAGLVFAAADVEAARRVLGERAQPAGPATEALAVPLDDVSSLRRLLNELDAAGVDPVAVSVARPTLDDVFLSLTGRPVAERSATTSSSESGAEHAAVGVGKELA